MKMKRWMARSGKWALTASVLVITAGSWAVPPTAAMLANACGGCHGTNGASAGPSVPSLAGQTREAIVGAMKGFKSGDRPSTLMGRLAKGYTDAEFAAMGDFFAAQKLHMTEQTLDSTRITKGAALHQAKCKQCHMENGKESNDDTPALASQWLPYLQMQVALYSQGKRTTPQKMTDAVKTLSAEELESLMHFYAGVK